MLCILGDSHTIAIREALLERQRAAPDGPLADVRAAQLDHGYKLLEPLHRVADDGAVELLGERARGFFSKAVAPTPARFERSDPRRFVFVLGFHPSSAMLAKNWARHTCSIDDAGAKMYVTRAATAALVADFTRNVLRFYEDLQRAEVRFSVAACCPLPRSFLEHTQTAEQRGRETLAFHARFEASFAAELEARAIPCHLPPPEVYNPGEGTLREALVAKKKPGDYHGNVAYGHLMLDNILSQL